jgi:2-oxoglutarate dehydrogenase E1 component
LAVSSADELANGTFNLMMKDEVVQPENVKRVVFCSGKVYYDLFKYRDDNEITDTALIRLEQIYPFPDSDVREFAKMYPQASDWVWCQEEPRNMGAWSFVNPLFEGELGLRMRYSGRMASASPAAGSMKVHNFEQDTLVRASFGQ